MRLIHVDVCAHITMLSSDDSGVQLFLSTTFERGLDEVLPLEGACLFVTCVSWTRQLASDARLR
jgi:hypothetical protein